MGRASTLLLPRKKRLENLQEQIANLQSQLRISRGITVIRVAPCGHPECGEPEPTSLPHDCMIVEMGCAHLAPPQVTERQQKTEVPSAPASDEMRAEFEDLLNLCRPPSQPARPPSIPLPLR